MGFSWSSEISCDVCNDTIYSEMNKHTKKELIKILKEKGGYLSKTGDILCSDCNKERKEEIRDIKEASKYIAKRLEGLWNMMKSIIHF